MTHRLRFCHPHNGIRVAFMAAVLAVGVTGTATAGESGGWRMHTINDRSPFEGVGVADFDGDGKPDVFSGDSWYQAPRWKAHKVREVKPSAHPQYHEDFANIPFDVNDDGHVDLLTCTYFSKRIGWIENPGKPTHKWIEHDIDYPGASEACDLVDINGDGRPDLLPATANKIVFYELVASKPKVLWKRHDVSAQGPGHGIGYGDINGDGRLDLIGPHGWYEQPPRDGGEAWTFHAEFNMKDGGSIMILGHDVDGDGLTDIIWGTPHGRGLQWLRQGIRQDGADQRGEDRTNAGPSESRSPRTWTRFEIDPDLYQVHTTRLVDLDGNGAPVLVAGTRVYGRETDDMATRAPEIAAYRFDRKKKLWNKTVIYRGTPAQTASATPRDRNALKDFARGTAGTGLHIEAQDMDGDGDLDLICPGKSGLYWFENPRQN